MKKVIYMLSFLLLVNAISLQAQINGKRWFTEVSAGGGKIYGPMLTEQFNLKNSLSLELGYMLTEHIGVIPASVSFNKFNKIEGYFANKIRSSVLEYRKRVTERMWRADINWLPLIPAESILTTQFTMKSISFSPGLLFIFPASSELRGFARLGAVYYSNRLSIETTITGDYDSRLRDPHKQSSKDLGFYLGAGMEYGLAQRFALNVYGSYTKIFTGIKSRNDEINSMDDLNFYYSWERGLELTSYPGKKNTNFLEIKGGLKFYFGL